MPHTASAPGSVILAAVLLLINGGLMLLWGVCGSAGLAMRALDIMPAPANPVPNQDWFATWGLIVFCGTGLPMVLAGIGVLKLNRAARILAYGTTLADLLMGCLPLVGVISAYLKEPGPDSLLLSFIFMGLFAVFKLSFDVPILICLSRSAARAAFSGVRAELPSQQA